MPSSAMSSIKQTAWSRFRLVGIVSPDNNLCGLRIRSVSRRPLMASVQPRCSKEEFARRGDVLYDQHIRPNFEPSHNRQFAAIGIETGEFKVDPDELD